MASISKQPNGRRTVQFVAPDGKRRSIRLGKVPQRTAETVKTRVELILAATLAGHAIDQETALWVGDCDDTLAQRLAAVGLIPKRALREVCRLGEFLESYVDSRADLKNSTKLVRNLVASDLKEYLGERRDVKTVSVADAENFKQWLIGRQLASTTVHKRLQVTRSFFETMTRRKLITENPFESVKSAAIGLRDRQHFVTRPDTDKLLAACPNVDWRTIVGLARFGGLRCPSEVLSLKLTDINWESGRIVVTSPKTEHLGKATRVIPLFPELRPILLDAAEAAARGAIYVVDEQYRRACCTETGWRNLNLRTTFKKIIRRAGLNAWPRLFHNLRASRETELVEKFPVQVVADWMGNTPKVALRHYLMTTDAHFEAAASEVVEAVQNPVQHARASGCTSVHVVRDDSAIPAEVAAAASLIIDPIAGTGLEPVTAGL